MPDCPGPARRRAAAPALLVLRCAWAPAARMCTAQTPCEAACACPRDPPLTSRFLSLSTTTWTALPPPRSKVRAHRLQVQLSSTSSIPIYCDVFHLLARDDLSASDPYRTVHVVGAPFTFLYADHATDGLGLRYGTDNRPFSARAAHVPRPGKRRHLSPYIHARAAA